MHSCYLCLTPAIDTLKLVINIQASAVLANGELEQ